MPPTEPFVLPPPDAGAALLRGVRRMARLLSLTLGPGAGPVVVAPSLRNRPPELLDNGGLLARRTIALGSRAENVGAMLVRHAACHVQAMCGDGSATTAALLGAVLRDAARPLAAGASATDLAGEIDAAVGECVDALRAQARPVTSASELAAVVSGTLPEPGLALLVGEAVEAVGPDGSVEVRDGTRAHTECDYADGVHWDQGTVSAYLGLGDGASVEIVDPSILVTDRVLDRAQQLVPLLDACVAAGRTRLFLIAPDVRGSALALLIRNVGGGVLERVAAVRAPLGRQQQEILEDLAVICGGRFVCESRGDRVEEARPADLGRARRAWATRSDFGIVGGSGTRERVRQRLVQARTELAHAIGDTELQERIRGRMSRLSGVVAIVRVGAHTDVERVERCVRVEAAVRAARSALRDGVVPGGGAALLACARALAGPGPGRRALAAALSEPFRLICAHSGVDAGEAEHRARELGAWWRYDVIDGTWVTPDDMARLVDPLAVVTAALETAASVARLTLTGAALVGKRVPELSVRP